MTARTPVEVIAGVLAEHRYKEIDDPVVVGHECQCRGWCDTGPGLNRVRANYDEHLAAEIVTALGLRQEWASSLDMGAGERLRSDVTPFPPTPAFIARGEIIETHYVTSWEPA